MRIPLLVISSLFSLLCLSGCVSYTKNGAPLLYGYYYVKGESMAPTLEAPTIVLVKPTPFDQIERGDIVVFNHRNKLVVHRAIRKQSGVWLTQGDSLKNADPVRVSYSNYRGLVYMDDNDRSAPSEIEGELAASKLKD